MEQPVKDPSEFKAGVTYIECSQCDWWYPEGHGCPDHNPWKPCRKRPIKVHYREPNAGIETIKTREGKLVAGYGRDYVIMGIEGEVYPISKEIFEKTYNVLDDVLVKLVGGNIELSCLCEKGSWIIGQSGEYLEDCDLIEMRVCSHCERVYSAKYRLISFDIVGENEEIKEQ